MRNHLLVAIRVAVMTMILTGVIYPLFILGIAQIAFEHKANGSLVYKDSRVLGSELIGQKFTEPRYFHPRPSAGDYDGQASGGSNLGPTNKKLIVDIRNRVSQVMIENPDLQFGNIPVDMITASGSGLDPHITIANAYAQVPRIASARHVSEAQILAIVDEQSEGRQFGILGEPRINVLLLNQALDEKAD